MAQQNATNKNTENIHVVICGGGIIGVSTAYYLAQKENVNSITIIERHEIAGCASGKAGGFLAMDWCDDGWLEPLARKSFQLHTELGQKYGDKYLYRPCNAYCIDSKYSANPIKSKYISNNNELQWIDCEILQNKMIGTKQKNATIHPRMFCEALINLIKHKITIQYGVVTEMIFHKKDKNKVIGVTYIPNKTDQHKHIHSDFVVIALGPWSNQSSQWFPECKNLEKISSYKYNSIVIQPDYNGDLNDKNEVKNDDEHDIHDNDKQETLEFVQDDMFLHLKNADKDNEMKHNKENEDGIEQNMENKMDVLHNLEGSVYLKHECQNGRSIHIEIYPRCDGTVYSCGPAKREPLPNDPSMVKGDKYAENIYNGLKELSRKYFLNSKLITKQAGYLPQSEDGAPFIGQISNYKNAFIGAAHRVWGILLGPGTGLILAEMIADGKVSFISEDALERYSPSRL